MLLPITKCEGDSAPVGTRRSLLRRL